MSHVDEERNRITLPESYRIRALPGLPGPDYIEEQSLVASTRSGGTVLRDILDEADKGCLITNVHKHTDERAHMINAQRECSEEKKNVEQFLIQLGLTHEYFNLDEISNIAWLDATLHTAFDKYDLFAITLPLDFGEDVRRVLLEDLANRQSAMDKTGELKQRPFQRFMNPKFQLVALHPNHLLPSGSTLLRRVSEDCYIPYKSSSDGLLRQVDAEAILSSQLPNLAAPPFPPFYHQTSRTILDTLNVYFVLLNADIKFQRFAKNIGLDKLHPNVKAIVEQTMDLVQLMYSQPQSSAACMARKATALEDQGLQDRPQGADAINYAEDDGEAQPSGSTKVEGYKSAFGWDALPLEQRIALGRDLFSRGSKFRHCSPSEEETETDIPPRPPLLLPVALHHQKGAKDIKGWAEGIF